MTLDDVAADLAEITRRVCAGELSIDDARGEALAVVAKREAWVIDSFQELRRTEAEMRRAAESAYRAKSRRGKVGASERADRLAGKKLRLERELGVRGTAPAGPFVSHARAAGG